MEKELVNTNISSSWDLERGEYSGNLVRFSDDSVPVEITLTLDEALEEIRELSKTVDIPYEIVKNAKVEFVYKDEMRAIYPRDFGISNYEFEKISDGIIRILRKAGCTKCFYSGFLD